VTGNRVCSYELRTTDLDSARAFYSDVVISPFWGADVRLVPLPDRAVAAGAPAHWLGHVGVADVAATAERILALGGQQLGPTQRDGDGSPHIVLRDPFGSVLALSPPRTPVAAPVAWHLLNTRDHERAFAMYAALFGWTATEAADLGQGMGRHQPFSWDESGRTVGSVADTARAPHIHPQWLFFFRVDDMDGALERTRAGGGTVLARMTTPGGDLLAPCEDPQGAAFALFQSGPR
jgi:predicted enzyme related to lactoylglutathione lyase